MVTPVSLRTLLKTTILGKIDEERDRNLELLPTLINANFLIILFLKIELIMLKMLF